jgi:hypothetical protein
MFVYSHSSALAHVVPATAAISQGSTCSDNELCKSRTECACARDSSTFPSSGIRTACQARMTIATTASSASTE